MNFNIGKIINYEHGVGDILTSDGEKYMFTVSDTEEELKLNDLVVFRPYTVFDVKRASFVKKYTKKIEKDLKDIQKRKLEESDIVA